MDFPKFSCGEPTSWIYRENQFFQYQKTAEDQKVLLASFHLEGEAVQWLQWYEKTQKEFTWEMLQKAICVLFGQLNMGILTKKIK